MTNSNATYFADIVCDLPDFPAGAIVFTNIDFFTSGNTEVFPRQTYTLTLSATGQGTQRLPCPDNTGTTAARWWVLLPSGRSRRVSIAYSATDQDLSDVLASSSTTTTPDAVTAAVANKANKVSGATAGNLASLTAGGDLADSGSAPADFDPAGTGASEAAAVQSNLDTHEGLTGTAVHGLGSAAVEDASAFDVAGSAAAAQAAAIAAAAALVDDLSGVTDAATARANIGAAPLASPSFTGNVSLTSAGASLTIGDASGFPTLKMRGSLTALLSTDTELQIGTGYTQVSARVNLAANVETAGANDNINCMTINRRTSGTPAVGLGGRYQFQIESSAVNTHPAADINAVTLDPTNATRAIEFSFGVYYGAYPGTYQEVMAMQSASGAPKLSFFGVAPVSRPVAYAPTNVSSDRDYDANSTSIDELADVLGTLIGDLQGLGLIS